MATVTNKTTSEDGNIIYNVTVGATDSITLGTAGTYSDKNIVFNMNYDSEDTYISITDEEIDDIFDKLGTEE